ncbi:hypothetical protein CIY_13060 [Butyrivibrio fibrisolvens 16/4]|nr:hypothetical protein CIY_13060 [Butyrivibrio fibrisolvens 16/4]
MKKMVFEGNEDVLRNNLKNNKEVYIELYKVDDDVPRNNIIEEYEYQNKRFNQEDYIIRYKENKDILIVINDLDPFSKKIKLNSWITKWKLKFDNNKVELTQTFSVSYAIWKIFAVISKIALIPAIILMISSSILRLINRVDFKESIIVLILAFGGIIVWNEIRKIDKKRFKVDCPLAIQKYFDEYICS